VQLDESELNTLAIDVAQRVVPILNQRLKAFASAAGWPSEIVKVMSVEFGEGDIFINYPEELSDEIDDLEYGKPFALPNPVIRPFVERNRYVVTDVLASVTVEDLLQLEEVF
jgi:hypothetical protein